MYSTFIYCTVFRKKMKYKTLLFLRRLTVIAEAERSDGGRVRVELAQPLLVEAVPYVHEAIRAASGKCVVHVVETEHTQE